jgi:hypothetical protein
MKQCQSCSSGLIPYGLVGGYQHFEGTYYNFKNERTVTEFHSVAIYRKKGVQDRDDDGFRLYTERIL